MNTGFKICGRSIGPHESPLVVAEIGINHEGELGKALRMVEDAARVGCECVKFQCHVVEDEMVPNDIVPANASESIWEMMKRCALSEEEDTILKKAVEERGMIYLSTPFSRAAAERLFRMGVAGFKIGSGECNNYPLLELIAGYHRPVLLSTGMNDLDSISPAVEVLRRAEVPFALLHCTSLYPTPYDKVRLGALGQLETVFPDAVIGLSDHSIGNYTALAGVALGARILEKHFTSDKSWPGPDIPISIDPVELAELIEGSRAVFQALGGSKEILEEEGPTIAFAYASVVTLRRIERGEAFTPGNLWVKRPGTGEIRAGDFEKVIGRRAARTIEKDELLSWRDLDESR